MKALLGSTSEMLRAGTVRKNEIWRVVILAFEQLLFADRLVQNSREDSSRCYNLRQQCLVALRTDIAA